MRHHLLRAAHQWDLLWNLAQQVPTFDLDPSGGVTRERLRGQLGTFTRASSKKVWDGTQYVARATNELPLGYDTVAGKWGYLLEGAATNSIANNIGAGSVTTAQGTMPTGWRIVGANSAPYVGTHAIVGTGVEDGIDYVDIQLIQGAGLEECSLQFSPYGVLPAAAGERPVISVFVKVVAGSLNGNFLRWDTYDGPGYSVTTTSPDYTPTAAPLSQQRYVSARPASNYPGGTSFFDSYLIIKGQQAMDVTLRIGWPQVDRSGFASSPTRTDGSAATRAEDIWRFTGTQFSDWYDSLGGTVYAEARGGFDPSDFPVAWQLFNTDSNRCDGYRYMSVGRFESTVIAANVNVAEFVVDYDPANLIKQALRVKADDYGNSFNGAAVGTDTSGAVPSGLSSLRLGNVDSGSLPWNGWLYRFMYSPPGAAQNRLQELST